MQQPPENPEQPSNPYQPQQTEPGVPPPPSYQQQPYTQYQQPYQPQPYTQYQQPYQPPMQPGMYPPPQQPKKRNRALFWIGGGSLALIGLSIIIAVLTGGIAGHVVTINSSSSFRFFRKPVFKVVGTITLYRLPSTL